MIGSMMSRARIKTSAMIPPISAKIGASFWMTCPSLPVMIFTTGAIASNSGTKTAANVSTAVTKMPAISSMTGAITGIIAAKMSNSGCRPSIRVVIVGINAKNASPSSSPSIVNAGVICVIRSSKTGVTSSSAPMSPCPTFSFNAVNAAPILAVESADASAVPLNCDSSSSKTIV